MPPKKRGRAAKDSAADGKPAANKKQKQKEKEADAEAEPEQNGEDDSQKNPTPDVIIAQKIGGPQLAIPLDDGCTLPACKLNHSRLFDQWPLSRWFAAWSAQPWSIQLFFIILTLCSNPSRSH
jgi:hypothetical protein